MKKLLIILALAALIAAYVFFGVGDYLTVDGIKRVAGEVDGYYQRHPVQVVGLFFLTYVAVTAASLPGAAVMTLAAGALFGVLLGTVVVMHNAVAFATGATAGFVLSRVSATRRALTFEIGIQNSGLALVILLSQLKGLGGAAAIAAVWGVWHLIAGGGIAMLFWLVDRSAKPAYDAR